MKNLIYLCALFYSCTPHLLMSDHEMKGLIDSGTAVPYLENAYVIRHIEDGCDYYWDWNRNKFRWEGIDFCEDSPMDRRERLKYFTLTITPMPIRSMDE